MSLERVAVTGAGRGLGLELVRQWLAGGRRVFALARDPAGAALEALMREHPERLTAIACDVADSASVAAAADAVAERAPALDGLVNNAGIYGGRGRLEALDFDDVRQVLDVNAVGPLRVAQAFLPLLLRGVRPVRLVHVSSLMGSLGDNTSGGAYGYRMSKSALNMANRSLAHDLAEDGILSATFHPGWVQTDMGGPDARVSVVEAARSLIRSIEGLTPAASGGFYDRDGKPLPW
ncbi:MAG: SDR family oxidoreductase [Gemmatimonadota bacterium]